MIRGENPVREPVLAQEPPYVPDQPELGARGGKRKFSTVPRFIMSRRRPRGHHMGRSPRLTPPPQQQEARRWQVEAQRLSNSLIDTMSVERSFRSSEHERCDRGSSNRCINLDLCGADSRNFDAYSRNYRNIERQPNIYLGSRSLSRRLRLPRYPVPTIPVLSMNVGIRYRLVSGIIRMHDGTVGLNEVNTAKAEDIKLG